MAPNPNCIVCSDQRQAVVKIDTARVTVKQFRDDVLVKALGMVAPDAMIEAKGSVVISSEDGETDCNNDKKLCDLEMVDGCILKVDDFVQRYELTVIIAHKETERDGDAFEVVADPDSLKPDTSADGKASAGPSSSSSSAGPSKESDNGEPKAKKPRHEPQPSTADSDDDLCIVEDVNENDRPTTSAMEKSEPENNQMASNSSTSENNKVHMDSAPSTSSETRSKRPRIEEDDDDDLILIDDD